MEKRPNILLIVSEDNGQHLSCYGDRNVRTPHLDALATVVVFSPPGEAREMEAVNGRVTLEIPGEALRVVDRK